MTGWEPWYVEEKMTEETLLSAIRSLYQDREAYRLAMEKSETRDAVNKVLSIIEECAALKKK